jgi:hypothetical protein
MNQPKGGFAFEVNRHSGRRSSTRVPSIPPHHSLVAAAARAIDRLKQVNIIAIFSALCIAALIAFCASKVISGLVPKDEQAAAALARTIARELTVYEISNYPIGPLSKAQAQFAFNNSSRVPVRDPAARLMLGRLAYRVSRDASPGKVTIEVLAAHPLMSGGQKLYRFKTEFK